ncbi:MAG TPA: Hsp20/alpha crystallin family protein [Vicinamibacterales bacterium]|nr:Hsp20/alpha crystallin family protein [Vicinamibacterales bacterium]
MTSFFVPSSEPQELADDIRELFADLASALQRQSRANGQYHPTLDVRETDQAVEVVVDIAGVPAEAMRVLFRAGVLLVVGIKTPTPPTEEQTYHLVEREFGRFARAVRVTGAFDVAQARATVENGELVVVLPKLPERRGRAHRITVTAASARPA